MSEQEQALIQQDVCQATPESDPPATLKSDPPPYLK